MELRNLNNVLPTSAYVCNYESHSPKAQHALISISVSTTSLSPIEMVKQYMLDEIKAIRENRCMLKNKYPELFSLYA